MNRTQPAAVSMAADARHRQAGRALAVLEESWRADREWLDLTVLRFTTHPGIGAVFSDYLIGVYHSMRTAGALMEAARLRSIALASECSVAARLVGYWTEHIRDEAGHDAWLRADLVRLGVDVERALTLPPAPEIAELIGSLHFWVLHTHPVGALAYFYVVESRPPTANWIDRIVESAGIARDALQTFDRHAIIDIAHGRELEELIDSLPLGPAHLQLLTLCGTTVLRQLGRILERLIQRAEGAAS